MGRQGLEHCSEAGKSGNFETNRSELSAENALAIALERASAAGQWDVVTTLAAELQARRVAIAGNVVPLPVKRKAR